MDTLDISIQHQSEIENGTLMQQGTAIVDQLSLHMCPDAVLLGIIQGQMTETLPPL